MAATMSPQEILQDILKEVKGISDPVVMERELEILIRDLRNERSSDEEWEERAGMEPVVQSWQEATFRRDEVAQKGNSEQENGVPTAESGISLMKKQENCSSVPEIGISTQKDAVSRQGSVTSTKESDDSGRENNFNSTTNEACVQSSTATPPSDEPVEDCTEEPQTPKPTQGVASNINTTDETRAISKSERRADMLKAASVDALSDPPPSSSSSRERRKSLTSTTTAPTPTSIHNETLIVCVSTCTKSFSKNMEAPANSTVYDLMERFMEKLGIGEVPPYMDLAMEQQGGYDQWLRRHDTLWSNGVKDRTSLVFKVRYFSWPKEPLPPAVVSLYFAQVSQHVIDGVYPVPEATAIHLSALWLQAQHGNYDPTKHKDGFFHTTDMAKFLPMRLLQTYGSGYFNKRLFACHSRLRGLQSAEAQERYLEIARTLPTFGATSFNVQCDGAPMVILVAPDGILLSSDASHPNISMPTWEYHNFDDISEFCVNDMGLTVTWRGTTKQETQRHLVCSSKMADCALQLLQDYYAMYQALERGVVESYPAELPPYELFGRFGGRQLIDRRISQLEFFKDRYKKVLEETGCQALPGVIKQIDHAMDRDEHLTKLRLIGQQMSDKDAVSILQVLLEVASYTPDPRCQYKTNIQIHTLDLSSNPGFTPDGIEAMSRLLVAPLEIKALILNKCSLTEVYGKALCSLASKSTCLESIAADDNPIKTKAALQLVKELVVTNHLQHVSLENSALEDQALVAFGQAVGTGTCAIRSLHLGHNKITDDGVKRFCEFIKTSTSLCELYLDGNKIGDSAVKHLLAAAKANGKITHLGLSASKIGLKAAGLLGEALAERSCPLRWLNVSITKIGRKGVRAIAEGLKSNRSLEGLWMAGNEMDEKAWIALAAAVSANSTINALSIGDLNMQGAINYVCTIIHQGAVKTLDLTRNNLQAEDFNKLGTTLAQNISLTSLDMTESKNLTFEALREFISPFSTTQNQTLKELKLDRCNLGDDGSEKIAALLRMEPHIEKLSIQFNNITTHGALSLLLAIEKNRRLKFLHLDGNQITPSPRLEELMGVTQTDLRMAPDGAGLVNQCVKAK